MPKFRLLDIESNPQDQELENATHKLAKITSSHFQQEFGFAIDEIISNLIGNTSCKLKTLRHSDPKNFTHIISKLKTPKQEQTKVNSTFCELYYWEVVSQAKWVNVRRLLLDPKILIFENEFAHSQQNSTIFDTDQNNNLSTLIRREKRAYKIYVTFMTRYILHNLGLTRLGCWSSSTRLDWEWWTVKQSWEELPQASKDYFLEIANKNIDINKLEPYKYPFSYAGEGGFFGSLVDSPNQFYKLIEIVEIPYRRIFQKLNTIDHNRTAQQFIIDELTFFVNSESLEDPTKIYKTTESYSRPLVVNVI